MNRVCLDTHILIWGIRNKANENQKEKIDIAKVFLKGLNEENIEVIVPSVVVAEFLSGFKDKGERIKALKVLENKFKLLPFDSKAALVFSDIWQKHKNNTQNNYPKENSSKVKTKFDFQVIAIAVSNKCDCIYTDDTGFIPFAKDMIKIEQMPDWREKEKNLFPP